MKRIALMAALACATGCSNAPLAGFLDNCFPSKARADAAPAPAPRSDDALPPAPRPRPDDALPPPDFGPAVP